MFDLEKMKSRVLQIADPNDPYTLEDFNQEFGGGLKHDYEEYKIDLLVVNQSNNEAPTQATVGSSGFDLRANISETITLGVGKRAMIPTGLFFDIPENYEIQIRPRSGLAAKFGVTVLNTPGTIDADYKGEIIIILINLGEEPFIINHGDRIAQGVFASVMSKQIMNIKVVDSIKTESERGAGGFGSTGKQ